MKVIASAAIVSAALGAGVNPGAPQSGLKVDPATAATVSGRVVFDGPSAPRAKLPVEKDPYCVDAIGSSIASEAILVGDRGALRNVFVYIKDGLDRTTRSIRRPGRRADRGHANRRRTLGLQVGQPLVILNSDATLHNVHGRAMANQEFNIGQPVAGMRYTRTFTAPEIMVSLTSDIHSWMSAYVGVVPHPFFAVSGPDGSFAIDGVPSGTYVLEAWHETLGTATERVVVNTGQTTTVSFTFRSRAAR